MDIVILFVIALINGAPHVAYQPFETVAQCEQAKMEETKSMIAAGITDASLVCTIHHVGKLT